MSLLQVEEFLQEFKFKLDFWGLLFRSDRTKNAQTLLDLEINIDQLKQVLRELSANDFVEGPIPDSMYNGPALWVFGQEIKAEEIYIKITIGFTNAEVVCISSILPNIL